MDTEGFRAYLKTRDQNPQQIDAALSMAARFEAFKQGQPSSRENLWAFSAQLIADAENSYESYLALLRYGYFSKDDPLYVAALEMLDGEEALRNLHTRLGERCDQTVQDAVFAESGVPPLGTPNDEKPRYTAAVMRRMAEVFDAETCVDLLKDSLRDLPEEWYKKDLELFAQSKDLDEYLDRAGEAFLAQLQASLEAGRLFFSQPVTQQVMDFLRAHPEIYRGERDGSLIYEVKIPYLTAEYLQAEDDTSRRYAACHCPWVREAIRQGHEDAIPAAFCNCSAGFHKRKWEFFYGQPLKAEVLESVLMGDRRCRFAIHLPQGAH